MKPEQVAPATAVLDTNVVLDWLVFRNPHAQPLGDAVASGSLVWLVTPAMRVELELVLAYPTLARYEPSADAVLERFDSLAKFCELAPTSVLVCKDTDDQKFIDLAAHLKSQYLLTRDKALLTLGRRASEFGLKIVTPQRWAMLAPRPQTQ